MAAACDKMTKSKTLGMLFLQEMRKHPYVGKITDRAV